MARKQTSRRLNRFLDLIGLVDSEREEDMDQEPVRTAQRRTSRRSNADEFDEFADYEEQTSSRQRRDLPSSSRRNNRVNVENEEDEFNEEQGWTNASPSYPRSGRTQGLGSTARTSASTTRTSGTRSGYRSSGAMSGLSSYERRTSGTASSYRSTDAQTRYQSAASPTYTTPRRDPASYAPAPSASGAYQRHQTVIFMLHSVDECKELILSLIDKKSVLMNLDELDPVQAQRALDTMSGATYAIGATLSRASDRTWLITPSNVDVERSSMEDNGYN